VKASIKFLALTALVVGIPITGFAQSATEDTGRGPSHLFGHHGQLAISSDAALAITHYSPGDYTTITLQPAVDYFVIDNFSVGGFIGLDYTSFKNGSTTRFSVGPRVGYNLTLSDLISIWPKIGFSFATTSTSIDAGTTGDNPDVTITTNDNSGIALNLFVPIMFHPAEHFFAGFGPFLDTDLSGSDKVTAFGLKLTLGGWLEV
jgi:hypothetical protein